MRKSKFSKKKTAGGCCGIIAALFFIALVASIFSAHGSVSTSTQSAQLTNEQQPAATLTALAQANPQATNVYVKPAPGATYMAQPTDTPTPVVQPTHQAAPTPTHQATPKPTPKPTQPPACQAVNNNPWCYNFSPGKLITNPPSNFCAYFNCIASFVGADDPDGGYIVECSDTTFSQSGGESGSCSHHGGNLRPLYSH